MLARSLTYNLSSIVEDGIGKADHLFTARFGWNVRELRVLRLVRASPGVTFTALAAATKFERSLTSRILSKLIRSGLVTRSNSKDDARVFTLRVTARGEALCAKADPLTQELEALMLAPLSAPEREALLVMVERLRGWVQAGYAAEVEKRFPERATPMRRGAGKQDTAKQDARR
jgi:DNA-binding MarR family transcriptional regulator